MAGTGKQHKIYKCQFTTLVCTWWSKMAKIPKISGTSQVKKSPSKTGKILKCGRWMLLGKNSELTGDGVLPQWARAPPQAFCPPRKLLLSLKLGPKTIDITSPPEGNSWKKTSMPWNNVAKNIWCVYVGKFRSPKWRGGGRTCLDSWQVCAPTEPKSRPITWENFLIEKHLKLTKMTWYFSWI